MVASLPPRGRAEHRGDGIADPGVDRLGVGVARLAGVEHSVDAIVFATGFETSGLPLTDRIYDARGVAMADRRAGAPTAYLGTAVAGYSNCFLIRMNATRWNRVNRG